MSTIGNIMSSITGISGGDIHQKLLQAVGMDQQTAAMMGAMKDLQSGNLVGYHQNLMEAMTGFESGGTRNALMSAMMGGPAAMAGMMAPAHFCCNPGMAMGQQTERIDLANKQGGGLASALGGAAAGFGIGGLFGGGVFSPVTGAIGAAIGGVLGAISGSVGKRSKAKCLEKRLGRDPAFRAQFEATVGGRYVPDGRMDGKITIAKNGFNPMIPGLMAGAFPGLMGHPLAGSVLSGMSRNMENITRLMAGFNHQSKMQMQGLGMKAMLNDGETRIRMNARPGGEVSKLPVPCTFEDLVAAFMFDMSSDMQEEVTKKMEEYNRMKANSTEGGGRAGRSRGGYMGGIGQAAGGIAGGMFGGPMGASMGSQLGGQVGGGLDGGSTAGANKGAQGGDESSRQQLAEKIKNLIQQLQQVMQILSNILNTMHQGSMNAIRNIRG